MTVGDDEDLVRDLQPDPEWMVEGAASPVIDVFHAEKAMMVEAERTKRRRLERRCSVPGCPCPRRHGGTAAPPRRELVEGLVDFETGDVLPAGPYRVLELSAEMAEIDKLDEDPDYLFELLARWTGKDAAHWRERIEGPAPASAALVFAVHEDVTRIHSRTFRLEDRSGQRLLTFRGGAIQFARVDQAPIPTFAEGVLDAMLERGLDKIGSVNAHRLLRWEIREGHRRAFAREPDARALTIEGGFEGLCEQLQIDGKHSTDLHAIVLAQAHCVFALPSRGHGNLLSYTIAPGNRRQRGFVRLILGDALLPFYANALRDLGNTRSAVEARRLVPVVDLPPFVGSPNAHGAQATLSMAIVREMRASAADLVTHGGAQLNVPALAARSGVVDRLVLRILDRWVHDGSDGPAFLKQVDATRFTLGEAHASARIFLETAGRKSLAGRTRRSNAR